MSDIEKQEDAARSLYKWTDDFFDWVWKRGALGKAALIRWFLVLVAPPSFNGYAIYLLLQLYLTAATLTDPRAVLIILTALANAEAWCLNYVLLHCTFGAYVR